MDYVRFSFVYFVVLFFVFDFCLCVLRNVVKVDWDEVIFAYETVTFFFM